MLIPFFKIAFSINFKDNFSAVVRKTKIFHHYKLEFAAVIPYSYPIMISLTAKITALPEIITLLSLSSQDSSPPRSDA